ncbi:MAG: sugar phosphate isomerase/epimerase [Clostridia bacterium]|nr:sugar phosphate isomerase/epimerase [Clostridia bacterium]
MMRLSVGTSIFQQVYGDKEGLKLIRDAGFDGVDYSFDSLPDDHPLFGENSVEYAREIREYMDRIGLVCVQAHAPFSVEYQDPFDASFFPYHAILKSMEAAAILGAEAIVVHAITIRNGSEKLLEDYNYQYYKTLEPYAQRFGIRIAVENLFNTDRVRNTFSNRRCGTPDRVNRLLARLGRERFTVCVDLGHAAITGFEPEEFLSGVTPGSVTLLHVQDTDYRSDSHRLPFLGRQNWENIMATLKKIDYRGDFNLEIGTYFHSFPPQLHGAALTFAHRVGRYLISLFQEAEG